MKSPRSGLAKPRRTNRLKPFFFHRGTESLGRVSGSNPASSEEKGVYHNILPPSKPLPGSQLMIAPPNTHGLVEVSRFRGFTVSFVLGLELCHSPSGRAYNFSQKFDFLGVEVGKM